MNPLYNELIATLNTHGPQRLEERLVGLDTRTMRTLLADMHMVQGGRPRDQLRRHFGLNTYDSGMPLGERVEREDMPLPSPSPIIDPTAALDDLTVPNIVVPQPTPPRPWGAGTSSYEIFQLIGGDTLSDVNRDQQLELIQFYRLMAHHTGPTALNKAIIAMAVKNAKDNALLSPDTKMVPDMNLVEALRTLRSSDPAINRNFPPNHTIAPNYIYKKGSHPTNIGSLNIDRMAGMIITANLALWFTATMDFHRWAFLYKRDPAVTPLAELQLKMRAMNTDIGAYIPNAAISSGLGLSRIEGHSLDEFNGRIVAETSDGPVAMHDPQFLYHPKFHLEEVVKAVRDRDTKRKLLPAYNGQSLNRPMIINRIKLQAGKIIYDTVSQLAVHRPNGGFRPQGVQNINGVPEELLIKAGRTKAFGSI